MVRHRKDGRWEGRIVIGHKENGGSIFHYFSAKTQRELMKKLAQNKVEYAGVDLCEDCQMPLKNWLDCWLNEYAAQSVRPSTLSSYRNYLDKYVKPALGEKPICKLTTADVQKLYQDVREHGRVHKNADGSHTLSPSTVRSLHGVFHQAMDAAVRERLIAQNPTEGVTLPKKEAVPKKILNDEQLDRFMEVIRQDEEWYDFFYTEITTDLRLGEICGLQWKDFDVQKGMLEIRRTVHTDTGGKVSTGETKTNQGKRDITLPPSTVELLTKRKKRCPSKKWIFPQPFHPDQPIHPQKAYRRMKELLEEANLPDIRFHDFRHTFATHALTSGVDAKTLSGILGHTKASFTLDTYTHVTGDMQRKAAEIVGSFMNNMILPRG